MSIIKRILTFFTLLWLFAALSCGGRGGDGNGGPEPTPTPPETPQNFTALPSPGQVTLSWDSIPGVTYELFHATTPGIDVGDVNVMKISPVTTPYVHTGLTNDVAYYYLLRAVNSAGAGVPTAEISAAPVPSAPPAAPQNFMAAASSGQITLSWDSIPGVTYELFHATTPGIDVDDVNVMRISPVTSPYVHTGLTNNTTYYYLLRAVNSFGAGVPTAEISEAPDPDAPPAAPQNFMAAASPGQITLSWDSIPGVTYELFHATTPGIDVDDVNVMRISPVTSPYVHTGLTNNTTYYYLLRAVNSFGAGVPTAEISAVPDPDTPPAAPQNFMASASSGQITLSWDSIPGVTYELFHATTPGIDVGGVNVMRISPVTSPYVHTGLTNDVRYYYRLRAMNSFGSSIPTAEVSAIPQVPKISAGGQHTCTVMYGAAMCWGEGGGQLGNNAYLDAYTPQQVYGLTVGVTKLSAGVAHTCAVVHGRALCWGEGEDGRLGHNEMGDEEADKSRPTQVYGLTVGVTDISAGLKHTCAVMNGAALCWGEGGNGRLGHDRDDPNETRVIPTHVADLTSQVTQISAGSEHTCAVMNGGVQCWGKGADGRLGHDRGDPEESRVIPTHVADLTSQVTQISAGSEHTCAVMDGGAQCWGKGADGRLGHDRDDPNETRVIPTHVADLTSQVTQISAGYEHTCAVARGRAFCWGSDSSGQLGNDAASDAVVPEQVLGLTVGVAQISAGGVSSGSHTCALVNGRAECWGEGGNGQLGNNTAEDSQAPVSVTTRITTPPPTPQNFMARVSSGQVTLTWAQQAGVTYDLFHSTDAGFEPESGAKISGVASPYPHTGLTNGTTYYYRLRAHNSVGASVPTGEVSATPRPPKIAVALRTSGGGSGGGHACAVVDGGAKCWGNGANGELGNSRRGFSEFADTPQDVSTLTSGVTDITAGGAHTCAVVNGAAKCWGEGINGELGNGTLAFATTPQDVSTLTSGVTDIAVGGNHTCAVANGAAWCWGFGGSGRLGHNRSDQNETRTTPTQVYGLTIGVTQISAGGAHTCAVVNGGAKCWGDGRDGRLGHNETADVHAAKPAPTQVYGLTTGVTHISAGDKHTCAVVNGGAKCWGLSTDGRLGNNETRNVPQPAPTQVYGLTTGVTQISAGGSHSCAVVNGRAVCWGNGANGRLGHNETADVNAAKPAPTQVYGLTSGVTDIAAGNEHSCAVVNDLIVCWGRGAKGRLGNDDTMDSPKPVSVSGL